MNELRPEKAAKDAEQQAEELDDKSGQGAGEEGEVSDLSEDERQTLEFFMEMLQEGGGEVSDEDKTSHFRNDISPENLRLWVNFRRPYQDQQICNVTLEQLQEGSPLREDSQAELVTHGTLFRKETKVSKKGHAYVRVILSSTDNAHRATFLIFKYTEMKKIENASNGCTIALCGFAEMKRDRRYDLAYGIWASSVAEITVLQETQQPAVRGGRAHTSTRGGVLTLHRRVDPGPPCGGGCGGSGPRGGGSSGGGGGAAASQPQQQEHPQAEQQRLQLPDNRGGPNLEQQLALNTKRKRGRPRGSQNTETPLPSGIVGWHAIVLKVDEGKRTTASARTLAKDVRRTASDLGLKLTGHELPTVNKIMSLWKSMKIPETTHSDIANKRRRRGRPQVHRGTCSDADMQGLSGPEEVCEPPVWREELQYANHLANIFFRRPFVYPVHRDTTNLVFCIPSMSRSPDGRLHYGAEPVFIHLAQFDDGTCAVQCSVCDKPAGFWPNNFYQGMYSVKKSSGFQSSDTSVDTPPILKALCKCAWALFAIPSRKNSVEPTNDSKLWDEATKLAGEHTQWPDLDLSKLGSSVMTTDTIFREHHDGWLIQVGDFGNEGCGFVKMYSRGSEGKYVMHCQTCGGKGRCRHYHALIAHVRMDTSHDAAMKTSRVHTEQSYKKVMERYAETPDTLKLLVKSKRLIPDAPEEEIERYLTETPVDNQVYFKLSDNNKYSPHQLQYMGFRSPGDLGSFGSGRMALWAPDGSLKDLPQNGSPYTEHLEAHIEGERIPVRLIAALFHIGGVVSVNIEAPFDGNDCAVINVDDRYMFSWELIRQFLLDLRLKPTNYSTFVRSNFPTWLRCIQKCKQLQTQFPSWINPKGACKDIIKSLKVRFSRAIHGYITLLDRDWGNLFKCRCVFEKNTIGSFVYDNACNAVCFIMNHDPDLLKTFSIHCDDFHHAHGSTGKGHVNCGPGTAMVNAGTHTRKKYYGNMIEQKNSKLKSLKALVYCSNQVWMMSIFRYYHAAENILQMAVLQHAHWRDSKTIELTQTRPHALFGVDATFLPQGAQHSFIQRPWEHPQAGCETRWGNPVASRNRQMIGLVEHRETLKTMLLLNKEGHFKEFQWTPQHRTFLEFLQTDREPVLWLIRLESKKKGRTAGPDWVTQSLDMLVKIRGHTMVRFSKECLIVRKVFQNWAARNPEVQFLFPNQADAINKVLTTHECTVDDLRAARDSSGQHIRNILDFDQNVNTNTESSVSSGCRALLTLILDVIKKSLQTSHETVAAANCRPLPLIEEYKDSESWLLTAEWFPNNPVLRTPTGSFLPPRRYIADEKKDGSPKTLKELAASSVCHKHLYTGKNQKHGLMTVHCMYCCQNVGFSFLDKPESVRTLHSLLRHRKMLRGEMHDESSLEQTERPIDADADVSEPEDSVADAEDMDWEDMSSDESTPSLR